MAVLKLRASSLLEALVSLFLTVITFSISAILIHSFYTKGIDTSSMHQRNQANALVYFHHFNQLEQFNQRFTNKIIQPYSIEKSASRIIVSFQPDVKHSTYVYILE